MTTTTPRRHGLLAAPAPAPDVRWHSRSAPAALAEASPWIWRQGLRVRCAAPSPSSAATVAVRPAGSDRRALAPLDAVRRGAPGATRRLVVTMRRGRVTVPLSPTPQKVPAPAAPAAKGRSPGWDRGDDTPAADSNVLGVSLVTTCFLIAALLF